MGLIRAIPVRKRVTNVISLSSGVKWALGAEGTVTVWSRWGSSSLRRYWRMTGKKPQRERVEAEYSTVRVGRCSWYDRGQDIGPFVMISAVRCCDTSIIRGRCSPLQSHLLLGLTNRHLRNACNREPTSFGLLLQLQSKLPFHPGAKHSAGQRLLLTHACCAFSFHQSSFHCKENPS